LRRGCRTGIGAGVGIGWRRITSSTFFTLTTSATSHATIDQERDDTAHQEKGDDADHFGVDGLFGGFFIDTNWSTDGASLGTRGRHGSAADRRTTSYSRTAREGRIARPTHDSFCRVIFSALRAFL
jgi:hypothetical protein